MVGSDRGNKRNEKLMYNGGVIHVVVRQMCIEFEPGYYMGVVYQRIGMKVLYSTKKATLMAKLTMYGRMVDFSSRGKTLNKFLRKSATLPRWGILTNNHDTMTLKLMGSLGRAFMYCPGVQWWDRNTSTAITRLLYDSLIKSPLHTNLDEVSSIYIVEIARHLSDYDNQHPFLIGALADVIENACHVRQLSVEELIAIKAYFETLLNRHRLFGYGLNRLFMHYVSQDTWFLDIFWRDIEVGAQKYQK
ncbi:hypothetical protein BU17DRAFT_68524 [Hysterangium stoloniferum]|nr:hypothetical protein BU17DRAFT_68524 [Hysterangium stoloniferum]